MTIFRKKVPSKTCSRCGAPIGHIHVNLHRNEERFERYEDTWGQLEVMNARVLKSYCMKCGVKAARNDLKARGFNCHDVEDYENVDLCTSCGTAHVNKYKWRPVYLIAVNSFDGRHVDTCEETVVVIACTECETKYGSLLPVPLAIDARAIARRLINEL